MFCPTMASTLPHGTSCWQARNDTTRLARVREALAILDVLAREGKLAAYQQTLRQRFLDALAKLPPEAAEAQ